MEGTVDRVSIEMFEANLAQNLDRLMRELKTGTFKPLPARRKYLDKGGGKKRPLGIPAVRDRVAQEVMRRLLSPLLEPLLHDQSYSPWFKDFSRQASWKTAYYTPRRWGRRKGECSRRCWRTLP